MIKATTYYSKSRSSLFSFVPEGIKKTLDVGCGVGTFSAGLKEIYDIETWGVEMVETVANKAASKLDNVLVGTFDDVYDKLPNAGFDCIFFNDVLEHMVDPYEALIKTKDLLSNDGVVVCSIPNVRHLPNLYELLWKKDWEYKDAGILDRTHLRFFTEKSIYRMFKELDYEVISIEGINPLIGFGKFRRLFYMINIVFFGAFRDTRYLQYACVVKPSR